MRRLLQIKIYIESMSIIQGILDQSTDDSNTKCMKKSLFNFMLKVLRSSSFQEGYHAIDVTGTGDQGFTAARFNRLLRLSIVFEVAKISRSTNFKHTHQHHSQER